MSATTSGYGPAQGFAQRFLCLRADDPVTQWDQALISLIEKVPNVTRPSQYHPIAVLCASQKVYTRMLLAQVEDRCYKFVSMNQLAFFLPGRRTEDAILTMRLLIEKAREWGFTLCFAIVDILRPTIGSYTVSC